MQKQAVTLRRLTNSSNWVAPRIRGRAALVMAAIGTAGALLSNGTGHAGAGNWGGASSLFNAGAGAAFDNVPASGDTLTFGGAGSAGTTLTDNLFTPANFNVGGITFSAGAPAYTINPATAGTNGFSLFGNITNSGTSLETINDLISTTAVRTITMTTGGGNITLGGNINGTGGGITTAGAGTLILSGTDTYTGTTTVGVNTNLSFGTSNVLGSNSSLLSNLTLSTGGVTNVVDLAGTSQTVGVLTSGGTAAQAGIITSSVAGGTLTLNEGSASGAPFSQTEFTGSLALIIKGNNANNLQMLSTANTFSGGLTLSSSTTGSAGSLSTANLNITDGLTGQSTEGLRSNIAAGYGTGPITLDNGQIFVIAGVNISNGITVTSRGGVLHMEGSGTPGVGTFGNGFSGPINNSGGILMIQSNAGNSNTISLSGSMANFSGTLAIDTSNIGGIALSGNSLGNSNANLLWYGTNSISLGTGKLEWNGVGSTTLTFGELSNLNSGAVGSSFSGQLLNNVAGTTATFSIGNNTTDSTTFQGSINNGSGTVALTKTGTNTQTLSGTNNYTGATNVAGGTLIITGSLNASSGVTVNSGAILHANGTGVIAGAVTVNGGGQLGGTGTVSGLVTLATGSSSATQGQINLVGNGTTPFNLSNAGGLTLGGTAGNLASIDMDASNKLAITGPLIVNSGGASIYITPGTAVAGNSYALMSFASGSGTGYSIGTGTTVGSLTLADPSISFGVSGVLNVSAGAVTLMTSGATAPANAYWSGVQGVSWNSTNGAQTQGNFTTDPGGTVFATALPGPGTNVYFAGNGATHLTTDVTGQAFDINSLTFQSSTGAVAIGVSSTLQIESGGITQNNTAGSTISGGALILGSSQTWNNSTSTPLTISSAVSGSGASLTIIGPVNLGGASFTTGATGSLTVNGALDVKGTSIATGNFNGSGSITNTGSANSTLSATVTSAQVYSGTLADGGVGKTLSIFKTGAGTLTLSGSNSYTGTTIVSGGTLALGSGTALGTSVVTIDNATTLDLAGQTITNSLSITGAGATGAGGALINSNTSSTALVNADMLSSPNFTVGGPGNITLQRVQNSNVFTVTDASTGILTLGSAGTTNQNQLLALIVNGGGTVLLNMPANDIAIDRGLTLSNGTVQFTGASNDEISGGSINISGGTLDLNGHTQAAAIGTLFGTGGTVTNTAASTTSTFGISTTTTNTYAGTITDGPAAGVIAVTLAGTAGIETFSGNNNYSGGTTVSGGATLIMGSGNALGQIAAPLTVSAGTLDLSGHSLGVASLNGTGATGNITSSGNTGAVLTLTVNNAASNTYAGQISNGTTATPDIISLVKNGAGTLTLSGASNFSGGTTINAGAVAIGTGTSLGSGSIVIGDGFSANAASLLLTGAGYTIANPISVAPGGTGAYSIVSNTNQDFTFTGALNLSSALTVTDTQPHAIFLNGPITSGTANPNFTISGGGTGSGNNFIALQGSNSAFTGNLLIVNNGFVKTHTGALSAANEIIMDSTARLDTGAVNLTVAGLQDVSNGSGGSTIVNAVGNLTLAGGGTYLFSGSISNSGLLTKSGSGTQILSGSNTYTGATNVSHGELVLASGTAFPSGTSQAGTALIVGSGATLQVANHGSATTFVPIASSLTNTGTIDLTNNAMIIRGGSIGTINTQAGIGYNGGAWNGTNASNGVITSSLAAGDSTHLTAVGVANGITGTFENLSVSSSDVLLKYTYYGDANLDGAVTSADYTLIDGGYLSQGGSTPSTGWQNGDFNYDNVINGSDYTLIDNAFNMQGAQINSQIASPTAQLAGVSGASAVPEPTSIGLIGIGAIGLLGRRRNRALARS